MKPKIKKKPKPKPVIEKLMEVLDELEDTTDCGALADVSANIERAIRHAKEVHNELLDLHAIRIDHEALLKTVNVFIDSIKTVVAAGKAKK